jgi:hypothetical protein
MCIFSLVAFAFTAGAAIAIFDNVMFEGGVSPIVIVATLIAATGAAGWTWGWRGGTASA